MNTSSRSALRHSSSKSEIKDNNYAGLAKIDFFGTTRKPILVRYVSPLETRGLTISNWKASGHHTVALVLICNILQYNIQH